jgi:hypothetical protein
MPHSVAQGMSHLRRPAGAVGDTFCVRGLRLMSPAHLPCVDGPAIDVEYVPVPILHAGTG